MAIGDRVPTELLSKSLSTSSVNARYTNSTGYRTQVLSVMFTSQSTATTPRVVTLVKNGTGVTSEKFHGVIDPTGITGPKVILIETPIILTDTDYIAALQDAGTDIQVEASGIVEQIS